ncbi:hypothetical protein ASF89_00525 [Frigoribacterium sp. Leaf172]|nr:hypothetical protein ASF89_00525 [Frigoribacterium sp. Leaf172]
MVFPLIQSSSVARSAAARWSPVASAARSAVKAAAVVVSSVLPGSIVLSAGSSATTSVVVSPSCSSARSRPAGPPMRSRTRLSARLLLVRTAASASATRLMPPSTYWLVTGV